MDLWYLPVFLLLPLSAWTGSLKVVLASVLVLAWRMLISWCQGVSYTGTNRLEGCVAVVTGANIGIGRAAASELVRRGARVILACRDLTRAGAAREEILQETAVSSEMVEIMEVDLSSLSSVRWSKK